MFTGLVEAVGQVAAVEHRAAARQLDIAAPSLTSALKEGESLAVNGVCLTVVAIKPPRLRVEVVPETLTKTTLKHLTVGSPVNLERALQVTDRLGGHFVQGHVDTIGIVESISLQSAREYWIRFPEAWQAMLVPHGSIAVDGVSLTIADLQDHRFKVAIIPHTFHHTIFPTYREGSEVNLEFDIIGKYVARWLELYGQRSE